MLKGFVVGLQNQHLELLFLQANYFLNFELLNLQHV